MSERFKNHVASYYQTLELGARVERLVFQKPGTTNDYIEFLSIGSCLIVHGDLYEAIYAVNQNQYLGWWGHTDANYMSGKLRGLNGYSEEKHKWSSEAALKDLARLKKEMEESARTDDDECKEMSDEEFAAFLVKIPDIRDRDLKEINFYIKGLHQWNYWSPEEHVSDKYEWVNFLRDHGEDIWGSDWWYWGTTSVGVIQNTMIAVHKEALDLALKQLKENGIAVLPLDYSVEKIVQVMEKESPKKTETFDPTDGGKDVATSNQITAVLLHNEIQKDKGDPIKTILRLMRERDNMTRST